MSERPLRCEGENNPEVTAHLDRLAVAGNDRAVAQPGERLGLATDSVIVFRIARQLQDSVLAIAGAVVTENGGLRIYGAAVWNHFLAETDDPVVVRDAWDASPDVTPADLSAAAYDDALGGTGDPFTALGQTFTDFAASTAEWREGEMRISGRGTDTEGRAYVSRSRFHAITPEGFQLTQDRSYDDGRTWTEAYQRIEAKRVAGTSR